MGVLDPTKVTRFALQNAASVASLMLTTDAMVAELPKDESGAAGGMAVAWVAWWHGWHGYVSIGIYTYATQIFDIKTDSNILLESVFFMS